jgi:polar amino acid transport system substrate-binding protein
MSMPNTVSRTTDAQRERRFPHARDANTATIAAERRPRRDGRRGGSALDAHNRRSITVNHIARRTMAACALLVTGAAAVACTNDDADETLSICTDVPFPPFEVREGGEIVGFDADLMNLLADRLGQDTEWVEIDFDAIQSGSALNTGRCDIAAAGMTINAARQAAMGMSDPYFRNDQAFVALDGAGLSGLEDLDGQRVGVQSGSTGEEYANEHADEYGFETVSFESMGDIAQAIESGSVAASIADLATWNEMIETSDNIVLVDSFETEEYYGFAVARDNTELLDEVNAMLAEAIEDGTYAEIYERWIGEPYEEG